MKIDYQLVTGLSSVCINIASATVGCDTQNLTKPEHWKEWDCDILPMTDSSNEFVPVKTKCNLICKHGYTPYSDKKKNFYKCRPSGWKPNRLSLSCIIDPDSWTEKIEENKKNIADNENAIGKNEQALEDLDPDSWTVKIEENKKTIEDNKNAIEENEQAIEDLGLKLNNNTCIKKCVGYEDNWQYYSNSAGYVDVNFADCGSIDQQMTEVTSVNTWLTCKGSCYRTVGSNSIYNLTNESFRVYIERLNWDGDFVQLAQDRKFQLHYEVNGRCK